MTLPAGTILGQYEIAAPLGEVYRARDRKLDREVAIKVVPEELATDPTRLARFEREAKALAALNHPRIATPYGFEREGDTHFLVMEMVKGEDLAAGLAPTAETNGGLTNSPTLTAAATRRGEILGTAAYMSPEQATGKPVDERTLLPTIGCSTCSGLTGDSSG